MPSKPNHRSLLRALAGAAAALLALAATPATAQTITLADGSNPTAGTPACPGGGFIQVNAFTLSFPTSTTATGVRLGFVKPGTWQLVDAVEVRDGATPIGSIVPTSDYPIVRFATALTITAAPKTLTIWAKLKGHEFMPPPGAGKSPEIGVAVSSVVSMYATTGSDATSLMPINNGTPPDIAWSTVSSTASSVTASWKSGARNAVVLRQIGGPVTGVPVEGRAYSLADGTIGADTIVAAGAALTGFTDSGRAAGKPHYYKVFVRDAAQDCGNWSLGASLGPVFTAGAIAEGATSGTGPVVGILNPAGGTVSAPFKIQARVFSPNGAISNVIAEADDGVAATPVALTLARNNNYGTAIDNGVFEGSYPVTGAGSLVAGKYYTLRVKATNASGTLYSGAVGVQLTTGKGDGNLLRRDNSSQLCDDCHGGQIKTHGSDVTGTKYGAWYVGCRGCHTPHSTTNAALVATEITPPRAGGVQLPPARVVFSTSGGFDPAAGATNAATIAAGSFANGDMTGPCQVCHTRTSVFRRSAQAADRTHNPGMPCSNCHKHTGGFGGAGGCTGCHGDAAGTRTDFSVVAPPQDTCGNTSGGRVGAHAKHLSTTSGTISDGVACSECHVESPTGTHPRAAGANCSTDSALKAQMTWGTIASTNGAPAPYNYASQTCSATYCHGNFTNSGVTSSVTWNGTAACGSCHHLGTRAGHTTATNCGSCHGVGYSQSAVTPGSVAWGRHVDGVVQATGDSCFACHGDSSGARVATSGVETTLDRYKGAPPAMISEPIPGRPLPTTQAHLQHVYTPNMQVRKPLTCDACHPTITALDHKNDVLDLPFTGLARTGGVSPAYDDAPGPLQFSCATTWCHGAGLALDARGSQTRPYWTSTDGTQDTCASCHGSPPANAKHLSQTSRGLTAASTCNPCHGTTVSAAGAIVVNYTAADKHVDGVFDTAGVTCASCHANPPTQANNRPANVANTNAAGAHQQHAVTLQTRTAIFACTTCHPNNTSMTHASGGAVNMTFAASFATSTAWDDGGSSCATSYCHGTAAVNNTPPIYKAGAATGLNAVAQSRWFPGQTLPLWTQLDGRFRACTACHGSPPNGATAVHPDNVSCAQCHPAGASQAAITAGSAAAAAHVDGRVDVLRTGCTACHGDFSSDSVAFNSTLAMPGATANAYDVAGFVTTTAAGVGAHLKHYSGTAIKNLNGGRAAVCADCHSGVIPTANNDVAHVTGSSPTAGQGSRATIAFSNVARTGLASGGTPLASAYQSSTTASGGNTAGTCASTYCHGKYDGTAYEGSNAAPRWTDGRMNCGSCHGSPPNTAGHGSALGKNCQVCHGGTYNCTVVTPGVYPASCAVDLTQHINGAAQVITTCTSCHGQPPVSVATLADPDHNPTGIGAHADHVNATGGFMRGLTCDKCHGSVPPAGDESHANGGIAAGFVAPANAGGVTPQPSTATFTTAWAANPTCTNYCHSNASPAAGTNNLVTVTWTSTTAMTCSSCHAVIGRDQAGGTATSLSQKHGKHLAGGYNYKCDECHAQTMAADSSTLIGSTALHVDGQKNTRFSTSLLTSAVNQSGGTYSGGTCASTYCHSGGVATASPFSATASAALAWTTGVATCRSCHGYNSAAAPTIGVAAGSSFQGSAAHQGHVSNAAVLGQNYLCGDCHATVVQPGTDGTFVTTSLHVNAVKNVSIANRGSFVSTDTSATCSATYCHSSGQATPAYRSITWASAAIGCNGCHGQGNAAGSPDYASGAMASATANSHAKHTGNGTDATKCDDCHSGFVTAAGTGILGSSHTNGTRNVMIAASFDSNGATTNYNPANKACASVTCHGGAVAQWGGPAMTCSSCHTDPTTDTDDYVTNNGTPSKVATDEWTARGHGNTNATFNEFGAATDRCLYCHDGNVAHALATNPYRLRGAADVNGATAAYNAASAKHGNEVCLNCHDTSNTVAYGVDPDATGAQPRVCQGTGANPCDKRVDAWHAGTDHTATLDGGTRCWDCHDPHGDDGVLMIGRRLLMDATDAYGLAGTRTGIDTSFANTTAVSYANTTNRQGVCQVCHTTTTYWQQTANATRDAHNPNTICVSCHDHQQPPNQAFMGAGDCTQCHATAQNMAAGGTRRPIMSEFQAAWSHKRSAGAAGSRPVSNNDCGVCHMEGDTATGQMVAGVHGNGSIELRDPDTGAQITAVTAPAANTSAAYGTTTTPVSFTRFSRNLSSNVIEPAVAAMMINQCLKCHDANGAAHASARVPGTGTAEKPFGTTIAGAAYTGAGITANGVAGGVVNVDASFNSATMASYHPIKFRQNNRFVSNTRMRPPWNTSTNRTTAATAGSTTTWGFLITCWDCHAPTNALGTQTMTVTAHGAAVTVKSTVWTTTSGLCKSCHIPYVTSTATTSHGAGSALNSSTNSGMSTYIQNQCHYCHSSGVTKPARPIAGQDVHGFDAFGPHMGTDTMWPVGATNTYRPFGFMRNVGATYSGRWVTTASWKPLSGPGVGTGSATCGGSMSTTNCSDSMTTYTPGGVY